MISASIRWWYRLCAWYFWHVESSVRRKRMKLEADVSHQRTRQRIVHKQQTERLEMFMRHERELLIARQQQLASHATMMQLFALPSVPVLHEAVYQVELVDHEILGRDPEEILPSTY